MLQWNTKVTLILVLAALVALAGVVANFTWAATNFTW
jgi:hypothetical protein